MKMKTRQDTAGFRQQEAMHKLHDALHDRRSAERSCLRKIALPHSPFQKSDMPALTRNHRFDKMFIAPFSLREALGAVAAAFRGLFSCPEPSIAEFLVVVNGVFIKINCHSICVTNNHVKLRRGLQYSTAELCLTTCCSSEKTHHEFHHF